MCTNLRNVRSHGGWLSIATGTIGCKARDWESSMRLIDWERDVHDRVRTRGNWCGEEKKKKDSSDRCCWQRRLRDGGAVGGNQPAVLGPIRLSEPARYLFAHCTFLPYWLFPWILGSILLSIILAVCVIIQSSLFWIVWLVGVDGEEWTTILDISADHVRVEFRCDDYLTCASNTDCVEWNRQGLSSRCFWYCLLSISWTT